MQSPLLVFDHVKKVLKIVPTGPAQRQLADLARSRRNQVATSGRPSRGLTTWPSSAAAISLIR